MECPKQEESVDNMKVQNANIFGRIGSGIGQGLAETLPKEMERGRLSAGLKQLGEQKDQTPFQQFSALSSIPGVTPQMIHSGSELLKQQGISNELRNKATQEAQPKPNPFPKSQEPSQNGLSPSLTSREGIEETLNNYIPATPEQIQQRAGQLLQQQPALYANDPNKALAAAQQEEQQKSSRNAALQQRRQNEQNVQDRGIASLRNQQKVLGAEAVPGNVYSKIEDKLINALKPKDQGGEGLTEQEAGKKYGAELDKAARNYKELKGVGNASIIGRSPSENKRSLKSIREQFKERNDLENYADTLVGENGLSNGKAYYLAYPPSEIKELNNELVKIPKIGIFAKNKQGALTTRGEVSTERTYDIAPKIAKAMGKQGSPLAIAEELNSKGYDGEAWLNYVDQHRDELDLSELQGRQLEKSRNFFPTLNDNWLFLFSGLDNLVEK